MKCVFEGDAKELGKVLRENRLRISRGVIKVTPLAEAEESAADAKEAEILDSKAEPEADAKEPKKPKK